MGDVLEGLIVRIWIHTYCMWWRVVCICVVCFSVYGLWRVFDYVCVLFIIRGLDGMWWLYCVRWFLLCGTLWKGLYGMCLCRLVRWRLVIYRTHRPLSVMMRLRVQLQQRALPCFHFQQTKGLEVALDLRVVAATSIQFLVSSSSSPLIVSDSKCHT